MQFGILNPTAMDYLWLKAVHYSLFVLNQIY